MYWCVNCVLMGLHCRPGRSEAKIRGPYDVCAELRASKAVSEHRMDYWREFASLIYFVCCFARLRISGAPDGALPAPDTACAKRACPGRRSGDSVIRGGRNVRSNVESLPPRGEAGGHPVEKDRKEGRPDTKSLRIEQLPKREFQGQEDTFTFCRVPWCKFNHNMNDMVRTQQHGSSNVLPESNVVGSEVGKFSVSHQSECNVKLSF